MTNTAENGPPQNERAKRICEARKETARNDAQIDAVATMKTNLKKWGVTE